MAQKKKAKVKKPIKKKIVKKKIIKKKPAIKKASKKKPVLKKKPAKKPVSKKSKTNENVIGEITHYFPHVRAGVIKLKAPLALGDNIRIKGHTTDITQIVTSIQIDRENIHQGKKGDEVGIQVNSRVRKKDQVIKA